MECEGVLCNKLANISSHLLLLNWKCTCKWPTFVIDYEYNNLPDSLNNDFHPSLLNKFDSNTINILFSKNLQNCTQPRKTYTPLVLQRPINASF